MTWQVSLALIECGFVIKQMYFNTAMCHLCALFRAAVSAGKLRARHRFRRVFVCLHPGILCLATGQSRPRRCTECHIQARLTHLTCILLVAWQSSAVSWHQIGLMKNRQVRQKKSHCYRKAKHHYILDSNDLSLLYYHLINRCSYFCVSASRTNIDNIGWSETSFGWTLLLRQNTISAISGYISPLHNKKSPPYQQRNSLHKGQMVSRPLCLSYDEL